MIGTVSEGFGNKKTSEDHPNYIIIKIGQNNEKNPEDLRRLAVTQTLLIGNYLKGNPSANAVVKNSKRNSKESQVTEKGAD